jgi:hypothetical protein
MYHQVLYQAADKLNNTLQNNKAGPLEVVLFLAAVGVVIGSAYMIRKTLKEVKQEAEMRKYKTS